ncbi:protein SPIRAL1-like 1 [Populus alba x Populus x berolinensis]|nr:protein SPIRAL1-like 1 [Populus alba x Populus x berolinensis]
MDGVLVSQKAFFQYTYQLPSSNGIRSECIKELPIGKPCLWSLELRPCLWISDQIQIPQKNMGRGVSAGGGQSSLGYLFGSGEAPKASTNNAQAAPSEVQPASNPPPPKPAAAPQPAEINREFPAGINSTSTNNYLRADGQNAGNFITDRPSTKVHAAPGGGSSLGYLFGGGSN